MGSRAWVTFPFQTLILHPAFGGLQVSKAHRRNLDMTAQSLKQSAELARDPGAIAA